MSYVQHSDGYSLKCDKCGAELHKEGETKPYISTDVTKIAALATEYGWKFNKSTISIVTCTYCRTFKRYKL